MSRLRLFSILLMLISIPSIVGCETDIDIIAPKKDVTIIYGLLEPNQNRHYIRINKAFIGEVAASQLAGEPGVTEYTDEELQAYIYEFNPQTDQVSRTWQLIPEYISTKEEGVFFNDSNKVYYFDGTLDVSKHYRIECIVNVAGEEEKKVTAETSIIGNKASSGGIEEVRLIKPNLIGSSSDPSQADRAEVDFLANGAYRQSQSITWLKASGGVSYTCYYRFYYTEVDKSTGTRSRDSLLFAIGTKRVSPNQSGGGEITFTMNPEEFYIRINQSIEDYDYDNADFDRIASDTLQFFLEIADNTLATYIAVNQPATEILQEQPEYTNVTNGIGVFASRLITSTRKKDKEYESGRVFRRLTLEELLYSNQVPPDESYNTTTKGFQRPGRCNNVTKECS
ncbi:MAG: hypothetical protein RLP15_01805 [Cryomorphaceae bacterium]